MESIKPTRSELIRLKKNIKLAKGGHRLLKKKRDGLIMEFFELMKKAKMVRYELQKRYKATQECMKLARIERSSQEIESLALAVSKHPELIMKTKNIMGVSVPRIEGFGIHRNLNEKGFGYVDLPAALLEAADAYEELVDYVVLAAEVETSMKKILLEIDHTKRRVNALEYRLIPQMQSVQSFIQLRLEEIERETVFRTKLIKKRLA